MTVHILKKYDFILDLNEVGDHDISFNVSDEESYTKYIRYFPNLLDTLNDSIRSGSDVYSEYKKALIKYRAFAPDEFPQTKTYSGVVYSSSSENNQTQTHIQ